MMKLTGWGVMEPLNKEPFDDGLTVWNALRVWSSCTKQFPEDGPFLLLEPAEKSEEMRNAT